MMNRTPRRIGVVTTGHGPRDEYVRYHQAALESLGAEIEIVTRHALDGLTSEQLEPHRVGAETPNIGAHVHVSGATGNRMGPGWEHRFYDLEFCLGRMQSAIDQLTGADAADLVILACAAELPDAALACDKLLIHPREILFSYAEVLAWGVRRPVRVGVLVDREHAEQDQADWQRRPWFSRVELHLAPIEGSAERAAAQLGERELDLAMVFGYGVGLVPGDPRREIADLEQVIGAPLLTPHRATSLFLRNLIMPSIDDRALA